MTHEHVHGGKKKESTVLYSTPVMKKKCMQGCSATMNQNWMFEGIYSKGEMYWILCEMAPESRI